jgi:hypothetical protein
VNPLQTLRVTVHLALTEALHALRQPRLMAQLFMLPIIFSTILAIFQTTEVSPARVLMTRPNTPLAVELFTQHWSCGGGGRWTGAVFTRQRRP